MDTKIEKMTVDGRRAEVHTFEQPNENGILQRITEHFEEIIPLEKKERITENLIPVVTQRVIEKFVDGQVIKVIESIDQSDLVIHQPKSTLTPMDIESIEATIRKIVDEVQSQPVQPTLAKPSIFKWFSLSSFANASVGYGLTILLAIVSFVVVWQLFIK